jgi:hypothetical protein
MDLYVLGANDTAMKEIEKILDKHDQDFVYAMMRGRRVLPREAYRATQVSDDWYRDDRTIFVECGVKDIPAAEHLTFQNRPPEEKTAELFFVNSPLGIILSRFNETPTQQQLFICAADFGPGIAYQGRLPGIDPDAFFEWRMNLRSAQRRQPVDVVRRDFDAALKVLDEAPRVSVGGVEVPFVEGDVPEVPEAASRSGTPLVYAFKQFGGPLKHGILNAPAELVQAWVDANRATLKEVYADPVRGYAGGYDSAPRESNAGAQDTLRRNSRRNR